MAIMIIINEVWQSGAIKKTRFGICYIHVNGHLI